MEQIRNCLCLYNKSKMSHKECDINRNAWSKVAEQLDFIQRIIHLVFLPNFPGFLVSGGKK